MSERNGDRARFQKDRKRKLAHRQRLQALMAKLTAGEKVGPPAPPVIEVPRKPTPKARSGAVPARAPR